VRPLDPKDRQLFSLMVEVTAAAFGRSLNDDGMLDIYYRILDWGYGWVFHHGTYCSVGITGLASLMTQPREAFQRFLASRNIPGERLPIRGRFIPCGGFQRRLCADRVLLAGDAAGLADPFQGEGIAYAIRSGRLAAETALTAEAHKDFSSESLAPFERACREAFDADLRHSLTLARVLRWWPSLIVKAMAGGPDVLQRYVRIATGEFTYREFIKWFAPRALWRWANAFVADRARARKGLQSTGLGTT
jgi:flavin-dependent dehydrogenase